MFAKRALLCLAVVVATFSSPTVVDAQHLRSLEAQATASEFFTAMLAAVNAERAKQGLPKMCYNSKLQKAAQLHSEDQAKNNKMTHDGSNGSNLGQRVTAQGFKWNGIAENVAAGQKDVADVMKSWMGSDGHRRNILSGNKFFGMGYAYNPSGTYKSFWTQDFGNGASEACDGASNEEDVIPGPTPAPTNPTPKPNPAPGPAPVPAATPAKTAAPTPAPTSEPKPTTKPVPATEPPSSPNQITPTSTPAATKKRGCRVTL